MKIENEITQVPSEVLTSLESILNEKKFLKDADIIYKGHVPHCGFLLVEGEICLQMSKNKSVTITQGNMIGIKELMNSEPFKFNANIKSNSKVYIIDKSTVQEILEDNSNPLKYLFDNLLAA